MDEQTQLVVRRRVVMRSILIMALGLLLIMTWYYYNHILPRLSRKRKRGFKYSVSAKIPEQQNFLTRLTLLSDTHTRNLLRMDRTAFSLFCEMLEKQGGLKASRFVSIPEKVACFLAIVGHHFKNRVIQFAFLRSGETVSRSFHSVLKAILSLHDVLVAHPEPVTSECTEEQWKPFQGCLGAIDGTYIKVLVPVSKQSLYRNRKGEIAVNVLGVCDRKMRFTYVLTGWEGSAADVKVLREAMERPNGFRVPSGCYYLADAAYTNAPGFLSPYRNTRYHLKEWAEARFTPQNHKEFFNMKHSSARNIIERTFGLIKKRFGILRSPSFYPIGTQNNIILACTLIHNFLRNNSADDMLEDEASSDEDDDDDDEYDEGLYDEFEPEFGDDEPPISEVNKTNEWKAKRNVMAQTMYVEWLARRNRRQAI